MSRQCQLNELANYDKRPPAEPTKRALHKMARHCAKLNTYLNELYHLATLPSSNMAILLLPDDLERALKQLLTNQLEGLGWDYFAIDLDLAAADPRAKANEAETRAFFNSLGKSMQTREVLAKAVKDEAGSQAQHRLTTTSGANQAMAYFFALLRQDPEALQDFIRQQLADETLVNRSDAHIGTLGRLNRKERKRRNEAYSRKITAGHRQLEEALVVLAEGDSWFQFPKLYVYRPVHDLIYHLLQDRKYAVKTLSAGGDWLASIAHQDEHLAALAEVKPNVLLLSGGGNDLVGGGRISDMVSTVMPLAEDARRSRLLSLRQNTSSALDQTRYRNGLRFVRPEFLDFLNQYFLVYFHLVWHLHQDATLDDLLIIVQGYDYVLPNNQPKGRLLRRLINRAVGNGKWLYEPLHAAGINNDEDKRDVMYVLIYEFNEMLSTLANYSGFQRLFHLDVRGFAVEDDWYDELHLITDKNKLLAQQYQGLITQYFNRWSQGTMDKIWRARGDS